MKKKAIIFLLIFIVFLSAIIGVGWSIFDIDESPNGDYKIVSWLIDKGGFGYSGAYYIKEKGLFSKWYKIGTGPFSGEWLSETEFSIYHSNPIDGNIHNYSKDNYYKEYSVDEFFAK